MVSEALQQSCCSQMLSVTINIIKGVSGRAGSPRFYMVRTCRIHPKNTGSPRIPPGSTPGSTLTANPKSIVKEPTDTRRGTLTDWPAQRTDLTSHRRIHRPSNPTERTTEQAARPTDQPERAPRASTRTQTDRLTERSTDRPGSSKPHCLRVSR